MIDDKSMRIVTVICNYFPDLEYQVETLSLSADDHPDVEDEESTPVSPHTPDNAMNLSVGPASESANFINSNPEVCMNCDHLLLETMLNTCSRMRFKILTVASMKMTGLCRVVW